MATPLVFPDELRSAKRPMMELKCFAPNDNGEFVVYVPIPSNVSFGDGASYNDAELGVIGGLAMAAARNINSGAQSGGLEGAIAGAVKTGTNAYEKASMKDLIAGAIGKAPVGSEVRTGVSIGMGATLNKNITTEFTGVGTREFSFAFKFIAKSESESQIIANIVKGFRSNLYPIGNFISLKYPPTWRIRFIDGVNGGDISYLPKIFECYLTGLTTNFNASVNIWHSDGSPIETDITVAFKESRALTYEDIKLLETKAYEQKDFQNLYQKINPSGTAEILSSPSVGTTETPTETPTNTETTKAPVDNTGGGGFGATRNVYGIGAPR
jgi:hypothetical protein